MQKKKKKKKKKERKRERPEEAHNVLYQISLATRAQLLLNSHSIVMKALKC